MAVMVTGGARSGKSGFAEQYAAYIAERGLYIATSQPLDREMEERVQLHQLDREKSGYRWRAIEEPLALAELLRMLDRDMGAAAEHMNGGESNREAVLVDCLTLWLTNWMLKLEADAGGEWTAETDAALTAVVDELVTAIAECRQPLVLVTNEVGDGIVPAYTLGRRFRDAAGRMNRRVAEVCDRVFLVTAGIPIELKAAAFRFEGR